MKRHFLSIFGLCFLLLAIAGCDSEPPPVTVDLSRQSDVTATAAPANG